MEDSVLFKPMMKTYGEYEVISRTTDETIS